MKLVVKESSEKRRRRQDFPTPADVKSSNVQLIKENKTPEKSRAPSILRK